MMNKLVVTTAGNATSSLSSRRKSSAAPHFKRSIDRVRLSRKILLQCFISSIVWGGIIAALWFYKIDPLTGFGLEGYIGWTLIHLIICFVASLCHLT